jgi:plasmid stabilization system protein ParE
MVDGIIERIENLNKYPLMGRMVPEFYNEMVRELIYKGYRIIYELKKESEIEILSVIHGSRLV